MSQKVSPLVDLSYCVVRPLDAAEGRGDGKEVGEREKGRKGGRKGGREGGRKGGQYDFLNI